VTSTPDRLGGKTMRVALYVGTFFRNKDGVARTNYHLVESLLEEGHEVEVWTAEVSEDTIPGVRVHMFPSLPIPLYPAYRFALPRFGFLRELYDYDPDVIHNATPDLIGFIIMIYTKVKGLPTAAPYHTDFPSYLKYYHISALKWPLWIFERIFFNMADATLAPTREIKARLESHKIRKVMIWSRGIDRERYHPSFRSEELRRTWGAEGKLVILFSGRFVWYKDIQVVMDVYKGMMSGPYSERVVFVLQGHGPEEEVMKKAMPLAIFSGYLSGEDLSRGYASSDLFLFPSRTETFGNVVQEAISSGLPAIVSDIGGCKEIVEDSGCGMVSKAGDQDSFLENLRSLIDDESMRSTMVANGQRYARERTWKAINRGLFDFYLEKIRYSKNRKGRR